MKEKIYLEKTYEPSNIVRELDKYIVGQNEAKKSVAISIRNRYRRMQLNKELSSQITPKNMLMVGPTGVGKTEIARRLSVLYEAPFIKVEATRFTEIGYVGKDVESIIRDLVDISIKMEKKKKREKVMFFARQKAEKKIIEKLLSLKNNEGNLYSENNTHKILVQKLRDGFFDEQNIEIETEDNKSNLEVMAFPGMEEVTKQIHSFVNNMSLGKKKNRNMTVKEALKKVIDEEVENLVSEEDLQYLVKDKVENYGIVFIDEIDKLTNSSSQGSNKGEVSREGVQRDLLPLIEGSNVRTKIGIVKTDNILFFASGSFYFSKPADLLPELQGRLPIKVYLTALSDQDFMRIMVEPKYSIIKQHQALLETEKINLVYEKEAIKRIAEISREINLKTENLGARRLHSVIEYLLQDISFNANKMKNSTIKITKKYVNKKLNILIEKENLDDFIL